MTPVHHDEATVTEFTHSGPSHSDMRRVSLSLAFSPARDRRRRNMRRANSWFKSRLGISWRRSAR